MNPFARQISRVGALCLVLGFLCITGVAQAQTCTKIADNVANICITPPVQFTDNTPIPSGAAITYTVQRLNGAVWATDTSGTFIASGWRSAPLTPGTYSYRVLATIGTGTSDPSNTASKTATAQTPNPPTIVIAALTITIPLDSQDGFKRTIAMTFHADGSPGVPGGFVKISTPVTSGPVYRWRNQDWCTFLENHPRTGASNVERWGVSASTVLYAPCA